ncbi:tyrosine--tRNA ligase [Dyadobacter chenwenxiniae]|uniref:Tyrosine--tRNA ligase n=1 Tax=Dyadobacter chenwenxiniae TaxID=2906456 RepID=A0A9X1PMP5_9BACT|nr:tyrosine--tRNA ligase [Dyadobacter chenwenxiniae]MCF0064222.1 tyrosine--tRNA ligase [Dyadobacter chenwenxiniae]UON86422.1 tyrosine--tRNA ligase [Dyadobacter chenwenxiniae]
MDFVEELRWRGMLHDMMPGTHEQLKKEMTAGYIGFDPTASSLHIGNLATIMLLVHFQRAGHKPFALIGGATGMIGDPSFKASERSFLDEDTLRINQEGIRKQLEQFLDFDCGENSAEMVNNYDWFKDIGFLQFLRDAGKFLSVNYMMSKDSVKKRLETGISFTEFSYQLLQGYDFYHLYKNKNIRLQMGGSDQWGNITTGTEIIRRKEGDEEGYFKAYALTTPLLTKSDGSKFGKSEGGNIWLDAEKTSPYEFYQFWLNQSDEDLPRYLRVFSFKNKEEIEELETSHAAEPHLRIMQKALASELTIRIHSERAYQTVLKASEVLFGKATLETLQSIEADEFDTIFAGVPQTEISRQEWSEAANITDLISTVTKSEIYASKGEARRAIQQNAVSVNKIKVTSAEQALSDFSLLQDRFLLVSKGKKNHLVRIKD